MCIAVAKQENIILSDEVIESCFNSNSDGAGFAYIDEGKVVIEKGFFSIPAFEEAYAPHRNKKALLHFRIKTHGDISKENCHPFRVNDSLAFIHNGVISGHGSADKSDTVDFNETVVIPLVEQYGESILKTPIFKRLVEKYIGHSKLVFLSATTGEFTIFNENLGNLSKEGVWFSNYSWRPAPKHTVPTVFTNPMRIKVKSVTRGDYLRVGGFNPYSVKLEENEFAVTKTSVWQFGKVVLDKNEIVLITDLYNDGTCDVYKYNADVKKEGTTIKGVSHYNLVRASDDELNAWWGV